jgi:SCF-associated factor 1
MDATLQALKSDGFSEPSKEAIVPHRLILNEPIRSVSAGRAHTVMLTATGKVLNFQSWGLPYTLAAPALRASGEDAIKQVEAGWAFGAALTHSGKVYVWWPASDPLKAAYEETIQGFKERVKQGEEALRVDVVDGTTDIPCHLFELNVPPTELGDFPADLPDLPLAEGQEKKDLGIRIIKIAAADNFLIALTNGGHVLKHDHLMHQTDLTQGRWEYVRAMLCVPCISSINPPLQMPNFSEVGIVREHEVFKKAEDDPKFVKPPQSMRITHVSDDTFTPLSKISISRLDICSLSFLCGLLDWCIFHCADGQCGLHFPVAAIYQTRAPASRYHFRRTRRLS